MDKILELIGVHGPIAGCFLAVGAVLGFHIKEDRARHAEVAGKLSASASKEELVRIHQRIDGLAKQTADNHGEVLGHLIKLSGKGQ